MPENCPDGVSDDVEEVNEYVELPRVVRSPVDLPASIVILSGGEAGAKDPT